MDPSEIKELTQLISKARKSIIEKVNAELETCDSIDELLKIAKTIEAIR